VYVFYIAMMNKLFHANTDILMITIFSSELLSDFYVLSRAIRVIRAIRVQ